MRLGVEAWREATTVTGMERTENTSTRGESGSALRPETISYLEHLYGKSVCSQACEALTEAYAGYPHSITATMADTLCQVLTYTGEDRELRIKSRLLIQSHHPSMRPFADAVRIATGVDIRA